MDASDATLLSPEEAGATGRVWPRRLATALVVLVAVVVIAVLLASAISGLAADPMAGT